VAAASARGLLRSQVAVAVPAGAPHPDIASEDAVRSAVLAARRIGCSTGPSGVQLARLFERWGLAEQTRQRLVQAPPGIPVGSLLARGEVDLGFQQLSELMHMQGVDVLGCLPPGLEIVTTFSAGLGIDSAQGDAVRRLLEFMASPQAADTARRHGMELA
jgi:molybdate transport system substrate-binding protein